jgi:hypothetical protein
MTSTLETRVEKLERCQPDPTEQMSQAELEAELACLYERFFQITGVHRAKPSLAECQTLGEALEKGVDAVTMILEQLRVEQLRTKQAAEASEAS